MRWRATAVGGCLLLAPPLLAPPLVAQRAARDVVTPTVERIHVCGIDRSGSYNFVRVGIERCAQVLAAAKAGDTFLVRFIADSSYTNGEFISRLSIPKAMQCTNAFDDRCRRNAEASAARINATKRTEIIRMTQLRPGTAQHTDVFGFIQAAADEFAANGPAEKHLYLATDLEDNRGFAIHPDLSGVRVVVFAFQTSADPRVVLKLRQKWTEFFTSCNAISVEFQPAEAHP
jgi:hypothetical protein